MTQPQKLPRQFRFCVGLEGRLGSSCWKLWVQGEEVYLLQVGAANPSKVSFHKSGNCRWALVKGVEPIGGGDRATSKWRRDPIPPSGSGKACVLIRLAFPTRHLATKNIPTDKRIQWLDPAPDGQALGISISLTKEPESRVKELLSHEGSERLVFLTKTRSGISLVATAVPFECGVVELSIPGTPRVPGQVFDDVMFPDIDTKGTGRTVRLTTMWGKEVPPTVWELGGYKVANFP